MDLACSLKFIVENAWMMGQAFAHECVTSSIS